MPFFETTMQQMQAFRQLQRAKQEGCSPVALTGCAMVQKAQLALTLSSPEQPVLILTGEEAEARRLCADINTMTNDPQTALLFPSKELVFAPAEGISTAYVHARLGVLSALQQKTCSVVAASIEALMQPVIPPEQLQQESLTLNSPFGGQLLIFFRHKHRSRTEWNFGMKKWIRFRFSTRRPNAEQSRFLK